MENTEITGNQTLVKNLKICRDHILKLEAKSKIALVGMTGFLTGGGLSLKENVILGGALLLGSAITLGYTYHLNKKKNFFIRRENRLYRKIENEVFYRLSGDEDMNDEQEITLKKTR